MKPLFTSLKELIFGKKREPHVVVMDTPTVPPYAAAPYKLEPQPPVIEPAPANVVTPEPVTAVVESAPAPAPAPAAEEKPKRARAKGKFKGDDKLTVEVNEAWEGGRAPAKKAREKKPMTDSKKLKVVKSDAATATKKSTKKK